MQSLKRYLQIIFLLLFALPASASSYSPMDAVFILIWLIINYPLYFLFPLFLIILFVKLYRYSKTSFGYYIDLNGDLFWIKNRNISKTIIEKNPHLHNLQSYALFLYGAEVLIDTEIVAIAGETYELIETPSNQ